MKRHKAPDHDSVTNEHIIHGGIHEVPLYKGGSTPKNKCDIYGSVPLMPSLLKTFWKKILCPAYLNL